MSTINVPMADPGQASFEELDNYRNIDLLSGEWPEFKAAQSFVVAGTAVYARFSVVAIDANNRVIPAVWSATPASFIKGFGITTDAVTGDGANGKSVGLFLTGCFNPDALIWPASFDTLDKKISAFIGSQSPSSILIKTRT
jgi:hypothetical protein